MGFLRQPMPVSDGRSVGGNKTLRAFGPHISRATGRSVLMGDAANGLYRTRKFV